MWKNFIYSFISRFKGIKFNPKIDGFDFNGEYLERVNIYYGLNNNLVIESNLLNNDKTLIQIKYQNGEVWQYRNIASEFTLPIIVKKTRGLVKIIIGQEIIAFNNNKTLFKLK